MLPHLLRLDLKWYLCLELEEDVSSWLFSDDLRLYRDVVGCSESSLLLKSFSIRLESEEDIEVLLNFKFGYKVELESVSWIDNEVDFVSGSFGNEKLWIVCNLDVLMALFVLCGDRAIKGNTDAGSGIWYNGFEVIGISGSGCLGIANGVERETVGFSSELILEFVNRIVWFLVFVFTFCVLSENSDCICWYSGSIGAEGDEEESSMSVSEKIDLLPDLWVVMNDLYFRMSMRHLYLRKVF